MPGDLIKLLSPVAGYPAGTTARVIAVVDGDECVVEFDDRRRLTIAVAALETERWSSLGMGQPEPA
jgi:hypothetical protein